MTVQIKVNEDIWVFLCLTRHSNDLVTTVKCIIIIIPNIFPIFSV